MICQPLAPWEKVIVAVRSSSPVPPDWLGPWELLLFSLGDSNSAASCCQQSQRGWLGFLARNKGRERSYFK